MRVNRDWAPAETGGEGEQIEDDIEAGNFGLTANIAYDIVPGLPIRARQGPYRDATQFEHVVRCTGGWKNPESELLLARG
ncbi:MAG: hypothetical protein EOR16_33940 [Mesorhizobium sp.]|uniref:hypothetical protein n=1 Tax=Mesorhizobium sp. TaxID=1871066 RepID=UPI000FE86732|nr:hypothetical protein [Mesorhizobium sp.]RWI47911.1 MAG: hypothetical protein EOR16_33940 [Mesorhizobium sp.]TIQ77966.1 MAG: hypothetical protein E5X44_32420 [Mesorhizobium sp.]TJV29057.1 MAG: hypothetical protein E5X87_34005 [Mesorhizobium sp.]TJW38594.1 MAG: hypothetical protein E5X59_31900 [Mesorhizobium sp.]